MMPLVRRPRARKPAPSHLLLCAGLACATLAGPPALAQEDEFRVALEVLVFLHLDPEASTEELGVQPPALPAPQTYPAPLALPDSGAVTPPAPTGLLALTRAQYAMEGIWSTMRRSAEYRPLAHFAWAMPAGWDGQPIPLRLSTLSAVTLPFSGVASLRENRFVHLTLDLRLPDDENEGTVFQLAESRRLLLEEIHYFDHPRFGAVARLFRYRESPQTDDQG
ncbi:CsiV family protein [Candidatus Foliamicus sp.]